LGFAKYAAYALLSARERDETRRLAEQLAEAMKSRAIIDQAMGVVMARERCDAATAMDMLRRASQTANVKVREIAERLVQDAANSTGAS
jgi:AmiR/NasT family two-component response regulator